MGKQQKRAIRSTSPIRMTHRRRHWRSPFPKRQRKFANRHRTVTCQIGPCCRLSLNVAMIYAKSCLPINSYVYFVIAGPRSRRRSGSDRTRSSSLVRIRAWSSQSLTRLVFIKSRKWCRAGWNSTLSVSSYYKSSYTSPNITTIVNWSSLTRRRASSAP